MMKKIKTLSILFIFFFLSTQFVSSAPIEEKLDNFKFKYYKSKKKEAAIIKDRILEYYDEIIEKYGFNDTSTEITIEIAKSRRNFLELYNGNDNFIPAAFARDNNYICINPEEIDTKTSFILSLLKHELTHSCIASTFKNKLPVWLEEGAAGNSELLSELIRSHPEELLYNYNNKTITSKLSVKYLIHTSNNVDTGYSVAFAAFYLLDNYFPGKNFKGYIEYLRKQQKKSPGELVSFSMSSLSGYYGFDVSEWNGWFDNSPRIISELFKAYSDTYKVSGYSNFIFTYPSNINITVRSLFKREPIRSIGLYKLDLEKDKSTELKHFYSNNNIISVKVGKIKPGVYVINCYKEVPKHGRLPWAFSIPFIVKSSE